MKDLPKLLQRYPAPWHVTMDGVKNFQGIWIFTGRNDIMHEIVELVNYAADKIKDNDNGKN